MNNEYTVTRSGNEVVVTGAKGSKRLNGIHGRAEEIPSFRAEDIRSKGANPADYFWFSGYPIRITHKEITLQIAAEITADYIKSPAGLRAERETLVARWQGSAEEAQNLRTRNFHRFDTGAGMGKNDWDAKAATAREALRAFDAAHPEIRAAIEQEKQEAAERFARTN